MPASSEGGSAMEASPAYHVQENWERLPPDFTHRDVAGIAVDSQDRVYVLTRMQARVIVYNQDGRYLSTFGEGLFTERSHGIAVGPDDSVYCVDDGDHTVRRFTPQGALVLTIGMAGQASDTGYELGRPTPYERLASITSGGAPFNRPTGVAVASNGELYVSDGYANARVHRFAPDGKLIQSWGQPGTGPGEFHLPHDVAVTADGLVLVADRENDRIQVFSLNGEFLGQWTNVRRPTSISIDRNGLVYVAELRRLVGERSFVHGVIDTELPGRVSVLTSAGELVARWGGTPACASGNFWAPHAICADSRGDVYVGEVTFSFGNAVRAGLVPADCHTLQKFVRAD